MKLASVTFSPKRENVGGAQIPAIAFKQWCELFDVQCDVIGILPDSEYTTKKVAISKGIDVVVNESNAASCLNTYNGVFFNTPPIYSELSPSQIHVPYVIMIHGEGDLELYGKDNINDWLKWKYCKNLAHINPRQETGLYWYPCTTIDDIISKPIRDIRTGNGLLYAARIRNWLNPALMLYAARTSEDIIERAFMMGPIANKHKADIHRAKGKVSVAMGDFEKGYWLNLPRDKFGLFWDVAGYGDKRIIFNRLSLSAFEALKNGFMPIVAECSAPSELRGKLIEVNPNRFDRVKFRKDVIEYFSNRQMYWERINEVISSGKARFTKLKVASQVSRIISAINPE